jgi:hypothetical protein
VAFAAAKTPLTTSGRTIGCKVGSNLAKKILSSRDSGMRPLGFPGDVAADDVGILFSIGSDEIALPLIDDSLAV